MEIASCFRHLSTPPRFDLRPTCSSDISGVPTLHGFCRLNLRGRNAVFPPRRISRSHIPRRVGDTAIETSEYAGELLSKVSRAEEAVLQEKGPGDNDGINDGEIYSKHLTDDKMVKVCDKLIEVFMVDKPTPTDWRRLLAFSREWGNIRPHFFKHCRKRADSESNPEMKHNLFRLDRKLKEIDGDMQRHYELINAVKGAPAEISSIVARRQKDFTKEFFVHLHTVAESYFDNPTEQNGRQNNCIHGSVLSWMYTISIEKELSKERQEI